MIRGNYITGLLDYWSSLLIKPLIPGPVSMKKKHIEASTQSISNGISKNLVFLFTEDTQLDGRIITIKGKKKINFASCSYLGLEQDQRLKQGAIDAINKYGTQYSSSRTYVSLGLYQELEELLSEIYGYPTLVTPTTSLGHISAIPILLEPSDLVILDHHVHTSVRNATLMLQAQAVSVEVIRHNNMQKLAARLEKTATKYHKIWYFADSVYSIFGDGIDTKGILELLGQYSNLHVYVDDAHGNSWTGKNGCGYVLSKINYHERMIISTSLNKSFAAGGSALICYNEEFKQKL